MKKIKLLIVSLLIMFIVPMTVNASSANISVSASNTVMLGNTVTVTVKLSSSSSIGSWQMDLNYDRGLLQFVSSDTESGGTAMANSSSGTNSKSYSFKFKAIKSGSAKVSVGSYQVYDFNTLESMGVSAGSAIINIKTKDEIEASYSDNSFLKSLSVEGHEITPAFDKNTLEYSLEVENDVATVTVSASKEDSRSSYTGDGVIELVEGNNKVEVTVTAQKGNTRTYVINVYRKELDPINVKFNGEEYSVVRKAEELKEYSSFTPDTVTIDEKEVPVLVSEVTDITLVGLKDSDGKVIMVVYNNGKYVNEYVELKGSSVVIIPLELKASNSFSNYTKKKVSVNGYKVEGYVLSKTTNVYIIYGQDVISGEKNYYRYNSRDESIQIYDNELDSYYADKMEKIKYVVLALLGLCILFLIILIFRKPSGKSKKKNIEDGFEDLVEEEEDNIEPKSIEEVLEDVKEVIDEEIAEEVEEASLEAEEIEEVEEKPKKKKKEEKKKAKEQKKKDKKEEKEANRKAKDFDW